MAVNTISASEVRQRAAFLRFVPGLTLLIFLGPVAAGLVGTVLPAFGYLPALGGNEFSFAAWQKLADYPGVASAALRSIVTGLTATLISFVLVVGFLAYAHGTVWFSRARAILAPLLAVPHAALAIGLIFLLSPSGWIMRMFSPWLTGFDRPPDIALAPDPYGIGLVLALIIKETPFLFLMTLGAMGQVRTDQSLRIAQSLGYDRVSAWLKTVLPQVYPQIRLPVFAIIAFSVSIVDVAIILTVTPAPTLGVLILRWINDPDLTLQFLAAAGACVQMLLVVLAIALWCVAERGVRLIGLYWIRRGQRSLPAAVGVAAFTGMAGMTGLGIAGLLGLAIWSLTRRWRFPDALPSQWSFDGWGRRFDLLTEPLGTTLWLGAAAAGIALVLVLGCLEAEQRTGKRPTNRALWLLYTPLIVPQIAFLFGAQVLLVLGGVDGHWVGLVWAHLLFVLPYVFLALSDPYRALDPRYARSAACLGASSGQIFRRVKIPMLLRPILIAFAVGFAVSVGEYLPTIFAGAGRLTTLTTEAVSLSGGGDRRTIGVLVVLQGMVPLVVFVMAALIPVLLRRAAFKGEPGT